MTNTSDHYRMDKIKVSPDTDPKLVRQFLKANKMRRCEVWQANFTDIHCNAMRERARTVTKGARIENMRAVSPEWNRYEACRRCKR